VLYQDFSYAVCYGFALSYVCQTEVFRAYQYDKEEVQRLIRAISANRDKRYK